MTARDCGGKRGKKCKECEKRKKCKACEKRRKKKGKGFWSKLYPVKKLGEWVVMLLVFRGVLVRLVFPSL